MTLPNLVIAGAPKCGTTSLFDWLTAHPDVCGSSVKETRFLFDRDWHWFNPDCNVHDHGLGAYHSFFTGCEARQARIVVEATTQYIYQRTAPQILCGLDPRPAIVFVLRRPSHRLYSWFQWARNNKAILDPQLTFARYVAEARDPDGSRFFRNRPQQALQLHYSRYIEYLEVWLRSFPASHLHVFLFEDLRRDARGFMRGFASRFGIDPAFYDRYGFAARNPTYRVRSPRLHRVRTRLANLRLGRLLPDGSGVDVVRRGFRRSYARLNVERATYQQTDEDRAVLADLDREFAPYNGRLADRFGLDLSSWE